MKRVLWIALLAAVAALALSYVIGFVQRRSSSGVAALLPRDTVAFAHVPDFNAAVDDWHRSDIYQIYREPAVQEFLKNPMTRTPQAGSNIATLRSFQELDARDVFVALTSTANDQPKVVGGFHFHCAQDVANRVIGDWRSKMNPSARHERVSYQTHDIDLYTQSAFSVAMVEDKNWFFASNDLEQLKAVLDRADGRVQDAETLLKSDESYRDAVAAMPTSHALLVYFQPKSLVERLATLRASLGGSAPDPIPTLQQIHSVCAATRFDHGKLHDVIFVAMPRQDETQELTRSSLSLATPATILYQAAVIELAKQAGLMFPADRTALAPALQKISDALKTAGISTTDFNAAFASEFSLISEWPDQYRWPSLAVVTTVKDVARARKIMDVLTHSGTDVQWDESDRDAAHFWSLSSNSQSGWFGIRPVMALSDRHWIAGLDVDSVEKAIQRSQKAEPGLADTDNYRRSITLVPTPTKSFTYLDIARVYSRFDATVRPFLLMGAAFLPKATDTVDLSKVPPPEAITRHLSPIVLSQYYTGKGYVADSVGPITMSEAGIGVAVLGGMGAMAYQRLVPSGLNPLSLPIPGGARSGAGHNRPFNPASSPAATPSPSAPPTSTP